MKNYLETLSQKLSLTRAEISLVSLLLGFLVIGGILKNFRSMEEESLLRKKAESANYREAEVDSLIQLAAISEKHVQEEVDRDAAAEESAEHGARRTAHRATEKKRFNGVIAFNKASSIELQKIPGIGPVMAKRLIAFRTAKGGKVSQFQEFLEVEGVGQQKLDLLKKHFTLE